MRLINAFFGGLGRAALVVVSLVAPLPALAQGAPSGPLVVAEGLRSVSPHVQVIPDGSVPLVPNVGFVVGDKAVLVVDTGLGTRNGAAVAAVARRLAGGTRKLYLVTTHFHPEHDLGAQGFPADTTMIRSSDQVADIAEFGLQLAGIFASRSAANAELLEGAKFRAADLTFNGQHLLDLGSLQVQLIAAGPNHTRGDTVVWVPADRVLFSGDVAMRAQPAFASPYSSASHWLASLDRLDALKPALVVPSHGPIGDAGLIAGYRAYLNEIRTLVAAAKGEGRSRGATVESVSAEMIGRFPDRQRLAGAIAAVYGETR